MSQILRIKKGKRSRMERADKYTDNKKSCGEVWEEQE